MQNVCECVKEREVGVGGRGGDSAVDFNHGTEPSRSLVSYAALTKPLLPPLITASCPLTSLHRAGQPQRKRDAQTFKVRA